MNPLIIVPRLCSIMQSDNDLKSKKKRKEKKIKENKTHRTQEKAKLICLANLIFVRTQIYIYAILLNAEFN